MRALARLRVRNVWGILLGPMRLERARWRVKSVLGILIGPLRFHHRALAC